MQPHDKSGDLTELRQQLGRVRGNYARFWSRYLDRYASDEGFHDLGERVSDESIARALMKAAGDRLHQGEVRMIGLESREIRSEGLVHGACFLNGRFCTFLVSRADQRGLMAMASLEDGGVVYSRLKMPPRAAAAAA